MQTLSCPTCPHVHVQASASRPRKRCSNAATTSSSAAAAPSAQRPPRPGSSASPCYCCAAAAVLCVLLHCIAAACIAVQRPTASPAFLLPPAWMSGATSVRLFYLPTAAACPLLCAGSWCRAAAVWRWLCSISPTFPPFGERCTLAQLDCVCSRRRRSCRCVGLLASARPSSCAPEAACLQRLGQAGAGLWSAAGRAGQQCG